MKKAPSILFIVVFLLTGHRASGQDLGHVSNNYWGGSTYHNLYVTASGGFLSTADPFVSVVCSSGLVSGIAKKKEGANALSFLKLNTPLLVDTTENPCSASFLAGYILESQDEEPAGYDTLRAFLENCPLWTDGVSHSWQAFSTILGAAPQDGGWPGFLAFLKNVLYLNPDSNWYCGDVDDMLTAEQANDAAIMSICQYIIQSGKCPQFASVFAQINSDALSGRHTHWIDSLLTLYPLSFVYRYDSINADTLAHPFADTAVPTLFQDSLEILMGPQYAGVQQNAPITSQALLSAQLLQNPINNEIDVSYQMGRNALVTMELRDVLGRSIPLSYAKYQLEQPGSHNASISAPNLPEGTYYLRITTDVGDAITLKIVKE